MLHASGGGSSMKAKPLSERLKQMEMTMDSRGQIRRRSDLSTVDRRFSLYSMTESMGNGRSFDLSSLNIDLDQPMAISEGVLDAVHKYGLYTIGAAVLAVVTLLAMGLSNTGTVIQDSPSLPFIWGTTSVGFFFSFCLNYLSCQHGASLERRVMSAMMMYISIVASLSYAAMSLLPLHYLMSTTGSPVFLMRYIEWGLTCPAILCWISLVTNATPRATLRHMTKDMTVVALGAIGTQLPPTLGFFAGLLSCGLFVVLMNDVYHACSPRRKNVGKYSQAVPDYALNLIRWEILVSWTLFPILDTAHRMNLLSTAHSEWLTCAADYSAKAGLGIIIVNCNYEFLNAQMAEYLAAAQAKTSSLLYDILPKSVAKALADGKEAAVQRHEEISVLFSDIKGFTNISSSVEPAEVMKMLNRLFSKFDELCKKHDVYKMETIGDAYVVVSGMPEFDTRHADKLAAFALDMCEAASTVASPLDGKPLEIRIGLNTGPVTSGVVGNVRPRYCIFGDCVNVGSRMESTGIPGRIQTSQAFVDALVEPSAFQLQPRGPVAVKGKGMMETTLLLRLSDEPVSEAELAEHASQPAKKAGAQEQLAPGSQSSNPSPLSAEAKAPSERLSTGARQPRRSILSTGSSKQRAVSPSRHCYFRAFDV